MKKFLIISASSLNVVMAVNSASATTLTNIVRTGEPSQGVYWALGKDLHDKVYYECFDDKTKEGVNDQRCIDANALKPANIIRRTDLM
jgi:hypothetical protein